MSDSLAVKELVSNRLVILVVLVKVWDIKMVNLILEGLFFQLNLVILELSVLNQVG